METRHDFSTRKASECMILINHIDLVKYKLSRVTSLIYWEPWILSCCKDGETFDVFKMNLVWPEHIKITYVQEMNIVLPKHIKITNVWQNL